MGYANLDFPVRYFVSLLNWNMFDLTVDRYTIIKFITYFLVNFSSNLYKLIQNDIFLNAILLYNYF